MKFRRVFRHFLGWASSVAVLLYPLVSAPSQKMIRQSPLIFGISNVTLRFSDHPVSFRAATSHTIVDDMHEYVMKIVHVGLYQKLDALAREICILKKLARFSWAPQLVWYNTSSMVTSYAGEPLDVFNIPLNYGEQYEEILKDMKSVGVNHGDIYKPCEKYRVPLCVSALDRLGKTAEWYELTVLEDKSKFGENPIMNLVDFGWATLYGSYSCDANITNKGPGKPYKPQDDMTVLGKLDKTFQRHLLLEQHFMVDWTNQFTEEKIREVVKRWPNLLIRKAEQHPMFTDDSTRVQVFSKFYNQKVDDFRGRSAFRMYFIYDRAPSYEFRPSSKGNRMVNTAMFDLKKSLRESMGGGFKIHATDNIQECKDNMKALGLQNEYQHRHFDTLRRVFDVLNFSGSKYVVLRNFEKMPDEVVVDPNHLDVDLLVEDYYEVKRILDGDSPQNFWSVSYENGEYRVVNTVSIGGKGVNFDVRFVGDNYLDKQWQQDILKRRVTFRTGIYVPSEEDHLFSIIYHAIIQKKAISDTYVKVITTIGNFTTAQAQDKNFLREKLDTFIEKHGYKMVQPQDKTVGYFVS